MNVAADFTMGIWVDALDMAAVGVGIGFTGADVVGLVCKSWLITITLYLLFTGALVLLFFSVILGPGTNLFNRFVFGGEVLVCGCDWVWVGTWVLDQAYPPILGMS